MTTRDEARARWLKARLGGLPGRVSLHFALHEGFDAGWDAATEAATPRGFDSNRPCGVAECGTVPTRLVYLGRNNELGGEGKPTRLWGPF